MKTLLLIDANSLIHRCYHAIPPLTNPEGEPVGALFGVSNILLKILRSQKPEYAAACFDRPEPTFRKEKFAGYKAQRPKAPDELVSQIINARKLFESFSIKTFDYIGYEADDLIGTLAEKFKRGKNVKVLILTGDLDSLQLIEDGKVNVETFRKGISDTIIYDEAAVIGRYGITSGQLIDYKALVGDPSDNVPGVPGVGPKTASDILRKYKTLDNFFKTGQKEKSFEKINSGKQSALMSRELVTIIRDVPVKTTLKEMVFSPEKKILSEYLLKNDFSSILKRIGDISGSSEIKDVDTKSHSRQAEIFLNTPDLSGSIIITPDSIESLTETDISSNKTKVGYDIKPVYKIKPLAPPLFDIDIALKLLGISTDDFDEASQKIFKEKLSQPIFDQRAYPWVSKKIEEMGLHKIMYEIEMPLLPVIAQMEKNGVLIDKKTLDLVDDDLSLAVKKAEDKLAQIIGRHINPNSPKQLLEYFQNTLHLKISSTSAETIAKAKEKNPLPVFNTLLEYRELFKLKTTYTDAFKKLIASDGRIHPTFLQLGAATGRLSCQNPNLQNIPAESEWAPRIRNIFISPKNHTLVSFDYSQIELRVLASLTGDKNMMEAFRRGEDIHAATAEKIFKVSKEKVTPQMRRLAKTLNFGIMYGMGFRAFSQNAGIPPDQAKEFIKRYFEEFSAVKEWEKKVLDQARKDGIAKNINGRFRDVHQINSTDQRFSSEAERAAKNMPSQSLAADILKLAMIKTEDYIRKNFSSEIKMILSIHDELIFEIDDSLLEKEKDGPVVREIKKIMDSAFRLEVPVKVDCKMGKRWGDMK